MAPARAIRNGLIILLILSGPARHITYNAVITGQSGHAEARGECSALQYLKTDARGSSLTQREVQARHQSHLHVHEFLNKVCRYDHEPAARRLAPLCGQRLGEAKVPGPSTSTGLTAPQPSLPEGVAVQRLDGTATVLRATWKSRGGWMFQLAARPRWGSSERKTEHEALESWIRIHGSKVQPETREALRAALELLPAPPPPTAVQAARAAAQAAEAGHDDAPPHDSPPARPSQPAAFCIPAEEECQALLDCDATVILARVREVSRAPPRSMRFELARHVAWLWKSAHDPLQPAPCRNAALQMFLLWPRLLLQPPARPRPRQHLPPRARVHELQRRLQLLAAGQWDALLRDNRTLSSVRSTPREGPCPDGTAGTSEQRSTGNRLIATARLGQSSKAWRRLESHGLAPFDEDTLHKVQRLMNPKETAGQPALPPPIGEREATQWLRQPSWQRVLGRLAKGKAMDCLGWFAEHISFMLEEPLTRHLVDDVTRAILQRDLPPFAQQLLCAATVVPLLKATGTIRPLSIPTAWAKLAHALTMEECLPEIMASGLNDQFGISTPDGVGSMAVSVNHAIEHNEHGVLMQLDIRNAFSACDRTAVLAAATRRSPRLAAVAAPMLCAPTLGVIGLANGRVAPFSIKGGIFQGDPLSAVLFAMYLDDLAAQATTTMLEQMTAASLPRTWAYIDDLTLYAAPEHATCCIDAWTTTLRGVGMELNLDKLQAWSPAGTLAHGWLGEHQRQRAAEGIVLAGVPVEDPDTADEAAGIPLGSPGFTAHWLARQAHGMRAKRQRLLMACRAAGPEAPGAHAALYIALRAWNGSIMHILRGLCPNQTQAWSTRIYKDLMQWMAEVTGMPVPDSAQRALMSLPLNNGGLNIENPSLMAPIYYVNGRLSRSHAEADACPLELPDMRDAISELEQRFGDNISHVLATTPEVLRTGVQRSLPRLRSAQQTATLRALPPAAAQKAALGANPLSAVLAVPDERQRLHNQAVCHTFRLWLEAPVHICGGMCYSTPASTHMRCNVNLDAHPGHWRTCSRAGMVARHNAIRDGLRRWATDNGFHAHVEQEVHLPPAPGVEVDRKRADLVVVSPDGRSTAVDITVGVQRDWTRIHCEQAAKAKRLAYRVGGADDLLPGNIDFVGFALSDLGCMSEEANLFMEALAETAARRASIQSPRMWSECLAAKRRSLRATVVAAVLNGGAGMVRRTVPPEHLFTAFSVPCC